MADKLLVRAYNVEVGDCIYCRIPKAHRLDDGSLDDFHILIDCGSKGKQALMRDALSHLRTDQLPQTGTGKRRLDLLVVTHEHQDHIKGFDPQDFEDMEIGAIWMTAAMDPNHIQAETTRSLTSLAVTAMRSVAAQGLSLDPQLQDLVDVFAISNDAAVETLRETLPGRNGIQPAYVHAGQDAEALGLPVEGAAIKILGPDRDIDRFYLGAEADPRIRGLAADGIAGLDLSGMPQTRPDNISEEDFQNLSTRMLSSAFAFADLASRVQNNSCVVLLIEWQGRRLLFSGDCEWEHTFSEGKQNGGWNVMWHQRRGMLDQPVDFLKIGHHGSINATPWNEFQNEEDTEPARILDAILPRPANGLPTAQAVVSTLRKNYETIPDSALLSVLGERTANTRNYAAEFENAGIATTSLPKFDEFEKSWISNNQPQRTDFEWLLTGQPFVDVEIEAAP